MRSTANFDVPFEQYVVCLLMWLRKSPEVDICTKCGPCLAKDFRQVSAAGFMAVKDLVDALLSHGLDNCVVVSQRLREACQRVLADHPKYLRAEANIGQTVDGVCGHIQKVLAIVRDTAWEDQNQSTAERRYPRSGGFRRKISKANAWPALLQTMKLIKLEKENHSVSPEETPNVENVMPDQSAIEELEIPETPVDEIAFSQQAKSL